MRSLALAAVALLPLLGGCIATPCDPPTLTFRWTQRDQNGALSDCITAGTPSVDVWIAGATHSVLAGSFRCLDGVGTVDVSGFTPGGYTATVEGVASDGTIQDRGIFPVAVNDCGVALYAPELGQGLLNIDYHFGTPGTAADVCYGSGTGYIWFDLWDEVANQAIFSISTATSTVPPSRRDQYACGAQVEFPVPFGTYTLRGIQEVVAPLTTAPYSVAESCSPTRVTVDRLGNATVTYLTPPDLVPPAAGASACYPGSAP
jgi:hypothetical protein